MLSASEWSSQRRQIVCIRPIVGTFTLANPSSSISVPTIESTSLVVVSLQALGAGLSGESTSALSVTITPGVGFTVTGNANQQGCIYSYSVFIV